MQVASGTTIRPDLAVAVSEYGMELNSQFMATKVLPVANTIAQSSSFGKLPIENITDESGNGKRAPSAGYSRQESQVENDNYTCEEYGFEEPVDDGEAKRIGRYIEAEKSAAMTSEFRLRRAQEVRAAALLFSASNFAGHTGSVTTEWNNSGNPINDISDTILTIKKAVGGAFVGEICVAFSEDVRKNIIKNATVQALLGGGTGAGKNKRVSTQNVNDAELAQLLGVDQIFYSCAQNSGSDVWDDEYALVFIRNTSQNLKESVQLGRTFLWIEDCPENAHVESYREDQTRSNIVRCRQYVDEKVFNYAAGYLLSNITT